MRFPPRIRYSQPKITLRRPESLQSTFLGMGMLILLGKQDLPDTARQAGPT
jgi:hypothetical protein